MECEKIPEVGSSGTGTEAFSTKLRVLVVDDDPICLQVVKSMIIKSQYEVVAAGSAMEALRMLRDQEGGFDLIITDVHMPGMDGFQLLYHIQKEFKIPVMMMSADNRSKVITKGLERGACFYLLKPVTQKDIQNIWQHVFQRGNKIEQKSSILEASPPSIRQKARMVWSHDLHNQFLEAIDQLGLDKAIPKKILELMNIPGLTRKNVASHLQKYRRFIKQVNEASISTSRFLSDGSLINSSFTLENPSLMAVNSQQGYPQLQDQQGSQMPLHEGVGANINEGHGDVGIGECLHGDNNLSEGVDMGSIGNFNHGSNDSHTRIQILSPVGLAGLSVTRPIVEVVEQSPIQGINSNYATHGIASSSGSFPSVNPFPIVEFSNVTKQQEQPQPFLSLPPNQQEEYGGDDLDSLFDMLWGTGSSTNEQN